MEESIDTYSDKILASLNNYWDAFLASLPKILLSLFLLAFFVLVAVKLSRFLRRRLSGKSHDMLFTAFVANLSKYVMIIAGLMIALQVLGLSGIAGGLLAGAGVSALVFGFAFKDIGENFLAGIILAFNRPFRMNDTIKILDYLGQVQALNFRTTHLKTFDEKDVFIPNAVLIKEPLTNLTRDGMLRLDFAIGIAYEDNSAQAIALILNRLSSCHDIMDTPKPFAVVEDLGINTVNIRVYFWTSTEDYRRGVLITKGDIIGLVKDALSSAGFTLPANIQELKMYGKERSLSVELAKDNGSRL